MRDDGITNQLYTAETIIQNYKTKQKIAGDSWQMYHGETGSNEEYDLYLDGTTVTSNFSKLWKITYQIEGGKTIPNAFAIFMDKIIFPDPSLQVINMYNTMITDHGSNPLVEYFYLSVDSSRYVASSNNWIGVKFRAISPYKGKIIFEETDL